jgi:hypothetical protein
MGIKIAHFETGFNSTEHIPEKVLRHQVIKFLTSINFLCKFVYNQIKKQHQILHFFGVHINVYCSKVFWVFLAFIFISQRRTRWLYNILGIHLVTMRLFLVVDWSVASC